MISAARIVLPVFLAVLAAAPGAAQVSTRVASDAPIVNFRLPTFTAAGHRDWLVRGSEARMPSLKEVDVRELTLTVFMGDEAGTIDTMLLAPIAKVLTEPQTVSGPDTIRVINKEFEATGREWLYDHREKRISIAKNVRVTFRAQLTNLLQ